MRPRQNGRHFVDDTFKRVFFNENVRVLINISLKFVPKGPINNILALVLIMAWCRTGDKTLSEPMFTEAYMRHSASVVFQPQHVNPWHNDNSSSCSLSYTVFSHYHTHRFNEVERGYTDFTSSVRLSVCPSVCGQNRVRSVSSTIIVGSISYLHILSINLRRCVECKGYCKIQKFVNFWNL